MAEAITGVAGKLVVAGLQRSASMIVAKAWRIKQIDNALRQGLRSETAKAALNDYEVVIGSLRGEFSESVAAFHSELEKSGLLEGIVEAALLDSPSEALVASYRSLYARFFPADQERATQLFESMYRSFRVSFSELSKDRVLFDLLTVFHQRVQDRFDRLEKALTAECVMEDSDQYDKVAPTIQKIVRAGQSTFRHVRVETNKGARDVDITRIYIPPKLTFRESQYTDPSVELAISKLTTSTELSLASINVHRQLGIDAEQQRAQFAARLKTVTYSELKGTFRRVVVLGDPGGGKSTLCQRICYELSKNCGLGSSYGQQYNIPPHEQKVPIRVILRLFEKARVNESQLDLLSYICRDLRNAVNSEYSDIERAVKYLLESGRAALAFDGLDEVLETSQRREFRDLVTAFCDQYPLCSVLITSRLVGYDYARLPDEYEELILSKFEDNEVKEYTNKFMQVVGRRPATESANEAERFISQTSRNAKDLRSNPLMLGLMCWLFLSRGDVPANRPEIYRDCAILMFERWDPDRGINAKIPTGFDRLQLFSSLAAEIYPDPNLRAGVEGEWLEASLKAYFNRQFESASKAIDASKSLVKFLTGRAWVMTEIGDNTFSFTHQTFLEYFFAKHLEDSYDSVAEILKIIKPRIVKREWDVVAHLALQLKTYRNDRRQEEAIGALLKYLAASKSRADRSALSAFMAAALEYLSPNEASVRRVLEAIVNNSIDNAAKGERTAFRDLSIAVSSTRDRKEFVEVQTERLLVAHFLKDAGSREAVIKGLGPEPNPFNRGAASLPSRVRIEVQKALRPAILKGVAGNKSDAEIAWKWYGHISGDLIERHGLEIYVHPVLSEEGRSFDGLTFAALAASGTYAPMFRTPFFQQDDAKRACHAFAVAGVARADALQNVRVGLTHVPDQIWMELFRLSAKDPDVFLTTVLAFNYQARRFKAGRNMEPARDPVKLAKIRAVIRKFFDAGRYGMADAAAAHRELKRCEETLRERIEKAGERPRSRHRTVAP